MALYQQSTLTFSDAKVKVANASSAGADTDMLTKAGDAIRHAFMDWNNARHWNFTKTTAYIRTIAPFTVANCVLVSGNPTITTGDTSSIVAGDIVSGTGIDNDVVVDAVVDSTTFRLKRAPTESGTVTLTLARRDYALPADVKFIFDIRYVTASRVILPVDDRLLDRLDPVRTDTADPNYYLTYPIGELGKIRFDKPTSGVGTIILKYHRRLTVPSTEGNALDIPEDFEGYILDLSKGYFLLEKEEASGKAQSLLILGEKGIRKAMAADDKLPDAEPAFQPSWTVGPGLDQTTESYALEVSG